MAAIATNYRERVPLPGWALPSMAALGLVWGLRRLRKATQGGFSLRKALSLLNTLLTALTLLRTLRHLDSVAIEVAEESICLGIGPVERRLPASAVRDVRVTTYNPLAFLGWGHRPGLGGGQAFSQFGVRRGVEITVHEEGHDRRYFVSSNTPEALAGAIAGIAGMETAA